MEIVSECEECGNEDTIDCTTGLCPDCRKKWMEKQEQTNEDISNLLVNIPRVKKAKEDVLKEVFE
jgi:uncharacterized Zn ribbon protein